MLAPDEPIVSIHVDEMGSVVWQWTISVRHQFVEVILHGVVRIELPGHDARVVQPSVIAHGAGIGVGTRKEPILGQSLRGSELERSISSFRLGHGWAIRWVFQFENTGWVGVT